ncbi:unnamed protein product [Urochloa humidicola]
MCVRGMAEGAAGVGNERESRGIGDLTGMASSGICCNLQDLPSHLQPLRHSLERPPVEFMACTLAELQTCSCSLLPFGQRLKQERPPILNANV